MKMFGKASGNTDATLETAPAGVKRDVTLCDEAPRRPDHVRVESDECTWKIGLTLDEQHELGLAYERNERDGEFDKTHRDEESFLSLFADRIYRSCANTLTIEFKPCEPGKVFLSVSADNPNFSSEIDHANLSVSYSEVGALILKMIEASQSRKELISDLVSLRKGDA